mgnify:CR=1 FL=1
MNVGDKAPEVLGVNEQGEQILLSHYRGKKVVLYFYPKDNTSAVRPKLAACATTILR